MSGAKIGVLLVLFKYYAIDFASLIRVCLEIKGATGGKTKRLPALSAIYCNPGAICAGGGEGLPVRETRGKRQKLRRPLAP